MEVPASVGVCGVWRRQHMPAQAGVWRCQHMPAQAECVEQQIPRSAALALPQILLLAAFASSEIAAHHQPQSLPTDTGHSMSL